WGCGAAVPASWPPTRSSGRRCCANFAEHFNATQRRSGSRGRLSEDGLGCEGIGIGELTVLHELPDVALECRADRRKLRQSNAARSCLDPMRGQPRIKSIFVSSSEALRKPTGHLSDHGSPHSSAGFYVPS